jgi:hypothetical protein
LDGQKNDDEALKKARKSINSLLNKVSEGNLAKIFKDTHEIIVCSPKPEVFSILAELFVKFNIDNPRVMINILATHVALICALHHLHGNQAFARVVESTVNKYVELK